MTDFKSFYQKLKNFKKVFSLDFFLKFNWLLTILFFSLILLFSILIWWQNFNFSSSAVPAEIINEENNQDFDQKDQKIKKIMEELEKRKANFSNFPAESLPRERVFKSNYVWEEETAPAGETKPEDESVGVERLVF